MAKKDKKHKISFFKDFKTFISKGNIMDLAVAVVIGAAFGAIINALVNNIIMPLITWLFHGGSANALQAILRPAYTDAAGNQVPALVLGYGIFIQAIINFLVIALCIFIVFRIIRKTSARIKKALLKPEEPAAPPAPPKPTQEELLTQIRDLLAERRDAEKAKEASAETENAEADAQNAAPKTKAE